MQWFFCLNDAKGLFQLAQVAVVSAFEKSKSLQPTCIYDGNDEKKINWFLSHHVKVIQWQTSMADIITRVCNPQNHLFHLGAYLRIDMPLFCSNETILYTDCDVVFMDEITDINPPVLAAAPQQDPHNWDFFNNGVMLLNGKAMKETYADFRSYISENMQKRDLVWDQDAYNGFYGKKFSKLPIEFNWKPYWGEDVAEWDEGIAYREMPIKIIHYHGPKPLEANAQKSLPMFFARSSQKFMQDWVDLYQKVS